jgi:hypothetical protein
LFYQDMINSGLSADAALQETNKRYGGGTVAAAAQQTPATAAPFIDSIPYQGLPPVPTVQPVDTTMPYDLGELSGLSRLGGFDPYGRFGTADLLQPDGGAGYSKYQGPQSHGWFTTDNGMRLWNA